MRRQLRRHDFDIDSYRILTRTAARAAFPCPAAATWPRRIVELTPPRYASSLRARAASATCWRASCATSARATCASARWAWSSPGRWRSPTAPAWNRAWPAACSWSSPSSTRRARRSFYEATARHRLAAHIDPARTLACDFTGKHPDHHAHPFRRAASQGCHLRSVARCHRTPAGHRARAARGARARACQRTEDHRVASTCPARDCTGAAIAPRPARRRCAKISRRASCCAPAGRRSRAQRRASSSIPCAARARWSSRPP